LTPKRYYTLMIEPELLDVLKAAKARLPEMSEAAIVRQALREWLDRNGFKASKPERKRASTRRRS
jgi:hypothetical protein